MIWLTGRQLRIQAALTYATVGALVVALLASTRSVGDTTVYAIAWAAVVAMPAIIGMFWGAPLVARELEAGTHRLAWTQSITRTRWLATKLGLGVVAAVAAAGVLTAVVTWWCRPIDAAINSGRSFEGILSVSRMEPVMFIARGIVPLGYTAFAFVLGATVGLLVRRTIPGMVITLVVFVAVQIAIPIVLRPQLGSQSLTTPITQGNLHGLIIGDPGDPVTDVRVEIPEPGAWITVNSPVDPSGRVVQQLPGWARSCAPEPGHRTAEQACFARLSAAGYRQRVEYVPSGRYWTVQAIETGLFVVLGGLLAGVCFWRIRRVG